MPTQTIGELVRQDFSSGIIDDLAVSDSLLPANAVRKGINVMFDRPRGSISQRYGTTKLGDTLSAGNVILGLHNHRQATATNHQLLAAVTTTIKYLNSGTWTNTVTGLTTGLKTRFLTYLDSTVFLNGTDAHKSWTGTGAWTSTGGVFDVASFPVTKYATILNGRVLAAGNSTYPSRIYESSIVSAGAVSWTSGNRTVDVYTNDGSGGISSVASNGRVALIFKDRAMFRYDGNELQRIVNIGTPSHESVVTDDNGVTYFFGQGSNGVGFYRSTGGYPEKISRPIIKWVESIVATFYDDVAGFTDGNKVYWSVGSCTVNGEAYSNVCFVYNIADQTWEIRNYADSFRVFSQYIDSNSNLTVVGGDTDGMVQTINSGNTDNGTDIYSECEMSPLVVTTRGHTKVLPTIITFAQDYQGLNFLMKVDDGDFKLIGSIDKREKNFSPVAKLRGQKFYPKITAVNSGTPFVFEGYSILDIQDEGEVH